jgi:hypothetical protein
MKKFDLDEYHDALGRFGTLVADKLLDAYDRFAALLMRALQAVQVAVSRPFRSMVDGRDLKRLAASRWNSGVEGDWPDHPGEFTPTGEVRNKAGNVIGITDGQVVAPLSARRPVTKPKLYTAGMERAREEILKHWGVGKPAAETIAEAARRKATSTVGYVIHHLDGDSSNNDPANLRLVDPTRPEAPALTRVIEDDFRLADAAAGRQFDLDDGPVSAVLDRGAISVSPEALKRYGPGVLDALNAVPSNAFVVLTTEHEPEEPTMPPEEVAEAYRRYAEENPATLKRDRFGEWYVTIDEKREHDPVPVIEVTPETVWPPVDPELPVCRGGIHVYDQVEPAEHLGCIFWHGKKEDDGLRRIEDARAEIDAEREAAEAQAEAVAEDDQLERERGLTDAE